MTIIDAMDDPSLFGPWFQGDSWFAWRVLLKSVFGLPLDEAELVIFRAATGRTQSLSVPPKIIWVVAGRRAGKSLVAALIAVFCACFRDYRPFTQRGEVATVMVVAADRKQARAILRYVKAFLFQTALLAPMVTRITRESVELDNNVAIEIHTCSSVSTRSYSLAAILNDEVSFWPSEESANADAEIMTAQLPGLSTIPTSLMFNITTGYARRGATFVAFETHYGHDDSPVLFWKALSRALPEHEAIVEMNPTIDIATVQQAYADDPVAASAEWGGGFRSDTESLFTLEMLEAVTDYDRPLILPYSEEEDVA